MYELVENLEDSLKKIEKKYGVSLREKSRKQLKVKITSIISYILQARGYAYAEIGKLFGHDHTTVMYAVKKVNAHMSEFEPELSGIKPLFENRKSGLEQKIREMKSLEEGGMVRILKAKSRWEKIYQSKGYKCEICGFDEVIQAHRRIPNKEYSIENCMVLCPNCHYMIHRGLMVVKGYNDVFNKK